MENLRKDLVRRGRYFPRTENEKATRLLQKMTDHSSKAIFYMGSRGNIYEGDKIPKKRKPYLYHGYNLTPKLLESVAYIIHVHALLPYWQRKLECEVNNIDCEIFDDFMPKY